LATSCNSLRSHRGYTLPHVSRETVGASTTFSARHYSYDARIMRDACEDQHVGDSNSRRAKIAGLSDLLDKHLSTVIANGGVISAKDIAASRYPTSRRQRASNDVAGAAKYLCLPSAPIWEHCGISAYCFCGSASGSRPFSHGANA